MARMKLVALVLLACLTLLGGPASAQSVALFEAGLGLPATQGWTTISIGTAAGTHAVSSNLYTTDSTAPGVDTWGQSRISPVALDGSLGYTVNFSLRVLAESHSNPDRAGFSMLFVGSDPSRSIEIAFSASDVFAYEIVSGSFVHGAGAAVQTGFTLRNYTLQVANDQYTLSTEGNVLFGGNLQDYAAVGPFVYSLPGFVFFGDNTSSGSSHVELSHILLTAVPEPAGPALWAAGLGLMAWRLRNRRG
jgi:hypothetical protein